MFSKREGTRENREAADRLLGVGVLTKGSLRGKQVVAGAGAEGVKGFASDPTGGMHQRRAGTPSVAGGYRIFRSSREVFPCTHGVVGHATPPAHLAYRCIKCALPRTSTASAPRRKLLSRLHPRPARTPVNASPLPLRATTLARAHRGPLTLQPNPA